MKVRITMPNRDGKRLKERVLACADTVEEDDMTSEEWEVVSTKKNKRDCMALTYAFPVRRLCLSIRDSSGC